MTTEPPDNLKAKTYPQGGIQVQMNIIGMYRSCDEAGCPKWIACPYVRCQEHRTDFAKKESAVPEWTEDMS